MQNVMDSVAALEDDFAIDIQNLPFATKHFSIRRVTGINILQGERSAYPIRITGERFGSPDSNEDIAVEVTLANERLVRGTIRGPNEIEFVIPSSALTAYFKPTEVGFVDLNVSATRQMKNCFFRCPPEKVSGNFKLLLTPQIVGSLEIRTLRPKFEWKQKETATRQITVAKPGLVELTPLQPQNGKQRRYGAISASCANIKREAWKLPNGKVLMPEDKLLTDGWFSSSYVGQPPGPSLAAFDTEAKNLLGFTPGFYHNNMCGMGDHCKITADLIRGQSTKLSELGYCDIMKVAAIDLTPDKERGSISFVGTAPYESRFEIIEPIEVLEQTGFETDAAVEVKNVSATGINDVSVPSDALVALVFHEFDGINRDGRLPNALPKGLKLLQFTTPEHAPITVYSIQFSRTQ